MKVKFFEYSDNSVKPLDDQINNWIDENSLSRNRIVDIKYTAQYIFNSEYEGIRDTALVMYREFELEESEWDKTLESIGIDPNKPLTLEDQEEESE